MRSTSIRFRSSGIARSPLRSPASTCATGRLGGARPAAGRGRVRVAVDEHPVRPLRGDELLDRRPHRVDVRGAQVEPVRGLGIPELLEEDLRHLGVPVLPRVDDDLVDAGVPQRRRERRRLDELGPVSDADSAVKKKEKRGNVRCESVGACAKREVKDCGRGGGKESPYVPALGSFTLKAVNTRDATPRGTGDDARLA